MNPQLLIALLSVIIAWAACAQAVLGPMPDLTALSRQFSRMASLNRAGSPAAAAAEEVLVIPAPENDDDCAICMTALAAEAGVNADDEDADAIAQMPNCQHRFHKACIEPWLKEHRTCPLCRDVARPPRRLVELFDNGALENDMKENLMPAIESLKEMQQAAQNKKHNYEERLVVGLKSFDLLQFMIDMMKRYAENPALSYRTAEFAARYADVTDEVQQRMFLQSYTLLQSFWARLAAFQASVTEMRTYADKTLVMLRRHPNSTRRQQMIFHWRKMKRMGSGIQYQIKQVRMVVAGAMAVNVVNQFEAIYHGLVEAEQVAGIASDALNVESESQVQV